MKKNDILLINPSSMARNPFNNLIKFQPPVPPLGLAGLAGALKHAGFKVKVIDQVARGLNNEQIVDFIAQNNIGVVGISCLTTAVKNTEILTESIKRLDKNIRVVLGNIHPTLFDRELLEKTQADIIVRGEGESTLVELLRSVHDEKALSRVNGISFKNKNGIIRNPDAAPIEDLDGLPFPDWSALNLKDYNCTPMLLIDELALPVQASRGCAYRCFFCAQERMHKTLRFKSVKRIVDEIEHINAEYGARYIGFLDAYFPFTEQYAYAFADEMIRRNLHKKIKWFTETRVDKVSSGMLKKLKESGLFLVQYGFESGNQEVLDSLNKGITLEQSRQAMQATKQAGLYSLGLFILGLPGETIHTCRQTIAFAKELDCDIAKFNIATPYPGSKFFERFIKDSPEGLCPDRMTSWLDWGGDSKKLIYAPEGITSRKLIGLQREAMLKFHVRPKIVIRLLRSGRISIMRLFFGGMLLIKKYFEDIITARLNSCLKEKEIS